MAGKTGTAQKADHRAGTYGSKRLASFVGFFPADKPRYLILVMVDEPTRNQYGGVVAAPVFKEIASRTLTYTGIVPEAKATAVAESPAAPAAGRKRGLKLAGLDVPYVNEAQKTAAQPDEGMRLPGHLAKAGSRVPDVMGKSVRNAVELFARAGVVPELKGSGSRVVKQTPAPGAAWPEEDNKTEYILWLSER